MVDKVIQPLKVEGKRFYAVYSTRNKEFVSPAFPSIRHLKRIYGDGLPVRNIVGRSNGLKPGIAGIQKLNGNWLVVDVVKKASRQPKLGVKASKGGFGKGGKIFKSNIVRFGLKVHKKKFGKRW